jgi:hypothetical protein
MPTPKQHPITVRSTDACRRLSFRGGDSKKRRARALANAIAFDDGPREEQIIWLQSYMTTEMFDVTIIASVPDMVNEGRASPVDVLVWETQELLFSCSTSASLKIVQTMFRCASVSSFPAPQVQRIFTVARMRGIKPHNLLDVTRLIAEEQRVLTDHFGHDPVPLAAA